MAHHPRIDRLMIPLQHPLHRFRIRQQEIEMTAARVKKRAAAHRAGSEDLVHDIFQQNLQIERSSAQTLQRPLGRNRINERLDARNIRRHEQIHLLLAHRSPALARRMPTIVRDAMRREILVHRSGIRRRQTHMIVKGNVRRLGARRARRHIAQDALQHAQKLVDLHIARRSAQEVRLQMLIKLLVLGHRSPHPVLRVRKLHPSAFPRKAAQVERLLRPRRLRTAEEIENTFQVRRR